MYPYKVLFGWKCNEQDLKKQHSYDNAMKTVSFNKYNLVPRAMFKILRKPLNIYFILITALSFISGSPKEPELNLLTITVILSLLIIKEAYDGWKRLKQDILVNQNTTWAYQYGMLSYVKRNWSEIKVGDFVTVWNDEEVPADILIVSSSNTKAYVDMNRIDGEMVINEKTPISNDIGGG